MAIKHCLIVFYTTLILEENMALFSQKVKRKCQNMPVTPQEKESVRARALSRSRAFFFFLFCFWDRYNTASLRITKDSKDQSVKTLFLFLMPTTFLFLSKQQPSTRCSRQSKRESHVLQITCRPLTMNNVNMTTRGRSRQSGGNFRLNTRLSGERSLQLSSTRTIPFAGENFSPAANEKEIGNRFVP